MNERIQHLSDIAYKNHLKNNPHSSFGRRDDYDREFAELIIRECLNIANREHKLALEFEWDNDDTAQSIKDSIRKHFGVEE